MHDFVVAQLPAPPMNALACRSGRCGKDCASLKTFYKILEAAQQHRRDCADCTPRTGTAMIGYGTVTLNIKPAVEARTRATMFSPIFSTLSRGG